MLGFLLSHWGLISGLLAGGGGVLSMFFPAQALLAVRALWAWLCHRSFWQIVCMGLAALLLVQRFELIRSRAEAAKWHNQFDAEHSGRIADRQDYAKAQTDAAQLNQKQVAHVKQQQQEITDATVSRLNSRLQLIADELRREQASAAPQRPSNSGQASDPSTAPCRATDPAWLCLSPEARLSAAESEERHDELIDWVIAQSKIDPNAEPKP